VQFLRIIVVVLSGLFLVACTETDVKDFSPKTQKQIPEKLMQIIKAKSMTRTSPILVRVYKEEGVLEVWKQKNTGRYDFVADFAICKMSGKLGPKFIEGDRQAPEGFYTITPGQMNPNSSYHLSFNTGYPNAFDRAHGRGGSNLMVHGACSSSGCYSMTDEQMEVIFAFARDAFKGGQKSFQFQSYPFRMTPENMARYRNDPNYDFWVNLKEGYDYFELTKVPPRVGVCNKKYTFAAGVTSGDAPMEACNPDAPPPALAAALATSKAEFQKDMTAAIEKSSYAAPAPTVQGIKEAKLVADWSKRRMKGEKVSREPPSLAAIEAAKAAVPVQKAALADAIAANASNAAGSVEPAAERFAATPLNTADTVAAETQTASAPVSGGATTAKSNRTEVAAGVAANAVPAVPTPNPEAQSMTVLSDSVMPLPPVKKKPWWKIIGQ
jgi:murein L,D-transpeptidase YafK